MVKRDVKQEKSPLLLPGARRTLKVQLCYAEYGPKGLMAEEL